MEQSDKKILAAMPRLNSQRVAMLLEEVIGCRWTISVLSAVNNPLEFWLYGFGGLV
jgi:hypothetical protein